MRTRIWRAVVQHLLFVALAVAGLLVRAFSTYGASAGQLVGLVAAAAVYLVLVRWGCWHWLSAMAALPALFEARLLADQPAGPILALLLLSVALVVVAWRAEPRPFLWFLAGALAVAGAAVAASFDVGPGHPVAWSFHLSGAVLVALALVGLAAALGLARSANEPLRVACGLLSLLPLIGVLGAGSLDALSAVVWWPAAGALGVTGLLRGRRGLAASLPQTDEVDAAARADFAKRYGVPSLGPVAVVIAAYNEAEGIPDVLATLPGHVCGLHADVIVVDDGSSDGTAAALVGTGAHVVACPVNRGQGAALRLGYRVAREHGADYVITTDADGQYDVDDFSPALAPILADRADFVTGSRIVGRQHTRDKIRRLGVHTFAWLATLLTGQRFTDTSFGLRAMRAEVTAKVTLNQPQYQSSELLLGAVSHGYRVLEVPGTMHSRSSGSTKKGRNLVYGSHYARAMGGTWWREGCPRPAADDAPALRQTRDHAAD
ncbi:MAG: glycosyltransferase family 2 protein [Nocardioidaceae bacterium]|nr:glycosyltransferase family 2 protein [Nocardioidaceae bacterium]